MPVGRAWLLPTRSDRRGYMSDIVDSAPYDLSPFSIPFAVTWPTAPTYTETVTVTAGSGSSLQSAIAISGRRIVVPEGAYNVNLTSWGNDIRIEFHPRAIVTGSIDMNQRDRIHWIGGTVHSTSATAFTVGGGRDLLIDGLVLTSNYAVDRIADGLFFSAFARAVQRIALINTTILSNAANTGGDPNPWTIHTSGNTSAGSFVDFILANVSLYQNGAGACLRLNPVERLVVVDSLCDTARLAGSAGFRVSSATDVFVENLFNIGLLHLNYSTSGGAWSTFDLNRAHFRNVETHQTPHAILAGSTMGGFTDAIAYNCRVNNTPNTSLTLTPFSDGGGNTAAAWNGTTLDLSRMPGKNSIYDYGAIPSNESRINTLLNGRTPHFSYNIPANPYTTRTVVVTSNTQFNTEAAINGTRIIVPSSFTGDVEILGDDIDVIMANSATIIGDLTLGTGVVYRCSRVRWTGGNVTGRLLGRQFEDILFDDFYLHSGAGYNDLTANSNRFDRIAFINTTIQNTGDPAGGSWALFVQQMPSTPHTGMIFGNFKILSTALHAFRLQSIQDLLIFDSALNPDNAAASTGLRLHFACENIWIKDSFCVGNMAVNQVTEGGDSVPHAINALFDKYDRYSPDFQYAWTGGTFPSNSGDIVNSTLYSAAGAGDGTFSVADFVYGTGNSRVAWDGSTVPDYSNIGAIR